MFISRKASAHCTMFLFVQMSHLYRLDVIQIFVGHVPLDSLHLFSTIFLDIYYIKLIKIKLYC